MLGGSANCKATLKGDILVSKEGGRDRIAEWVDKVSADGAACEGCSPGGKGIGNDTKVLCNLSFLEIALGSRHCGT